MFAFALQVLLAACSGIRAEDVVRVPMNRLDPEKLLELLVTVSKAIYQKPKYLRW